MLINERQLQVLPTLAVRLGLNEAIAVQQLHFAVQTFEGRVVDLDGHRWLRADMQWWCEQFPWWSKATIERIWKSLRSLNLVHTSRGREANVYRIDYEALRQIEGSDTSDRPVQIPQSDGSPCKGEGTTEKSEETAPAADAATLFETAPPSPAEDDPGKVDVKANVEAVWAHYVKVHDPARKNLTPSRERMILKALRETKDVELCCRAIDGLKSWRKNKPGEISLSAIFATRPGGSALGDQIEWWANQAEERRGFDLSRIPSVMRATVNSDRALVRRGLASDDEHTQRMGREAAERLRGNWKIVPVIDNGELKGWHYED